MKNILIKVTVGLITAGAIYQIVLVIASASLIINDYV